MENLALSVENVSKLYRLGEVGTGMLTQDLNRWMHRIAGKEDPYKKLGELNDRTDAGKTSGFVWAVKDISFTVEKGEVLGIIGRNGAGKSTLLKLLSRITGPTDGEIKISGKLSSLLEVGTGFHPELTGRENVYLNGTILGMTKKEVKLKFDQIVEFAGVSKYIDTPVKRYSSGMMVRLGFAVAAHLEPDILIVDEVLAVGDQDFQDKCVSKMNEVSKEGRTVLFVSHNLNSIRQLCTRGLLLENGRMVMSGDVHAVINHYLQRNSQTGISDYSFIDYSPRSGSGLVKFIHLKINPYSLKRNIISVGDNLDLELSLTSKMEIPNLILAIHIYEVDENMIANIENRDSKFVIEPFKGDRTFQIRFSNLNLYPGTYKLGFWLGSTSGSETYDHLLYCAEFTVDDLSPAVCRPLMRIKGLFYFQPEWQIKE